MLDIFSLIVIFVLVAVVIGLVVVFGSLPGKIARGRNHPQAEAITALGWVGIALLGVPWLLALVWAYTKPVSLAGDASPEARLAAVEARLEQLSEGGVTP